MYLITARTDIAVDTMRDNNSDEATTQQLFLLINQLDDSIDSVLLIGHNPGISYLCDYLQGTNHTEMAPGELIGITMEVERWSEVSKGIGLSL